MSPVAAPPAERSREVGLVLLLGPLLSELWLLLPHGHEPGLAVLGVALAAQAVGAGLTFGWLRPRPVSLYLVGGLVLAAAIAASALSAEGPSAFAEGLGNWVAPIVTVAVVALVVHHLVATTSASDARFRQAFLTSHSGMALIDSGGRWLEVNASLCRMLGDEPERLIGRPVADRLQSNTGGDILAAIHEVARHPIGEAQVLARFSRGSSPLQARVVVSPMADRRESRYLLAQIEEVTDRKLAVERLQSVEGRFRALIERLPVVTYVAAPGPRGHWSFVSPQIADVTGYTPGEWLADSGLWLDSIHPDDRETVAAAEARVEVSGGILDVEYRMVARDGTIRWIRDTATLRRGVPDGVLQLEGVLMDLTDRRRSEDEAARSAALLAETQRAARIGAWDWDLETGVMTWSEEMFRIHGMVPGQIEPNRDELVRLVHPNDRAELAAALEGALSDGRPWTLRSRIVQQEGEERVVYGRGTVERTSDGRVRRLRAFVQDVTERTRAERALERSHAQLQAIMDSSPSAIYVKDTALEYVMTNTAFDRMIGASPDASEGEFAAVAREREQQVLVESKSLEDEETLYVQGARRVLLTQRFPLLDADGRVYAVCGVSTDVTERKLREEALADDMAWSNRIRDAVRTRRFELFAQPIVAVGSGRVEQHELLVRMRDQTGELVSPGAFLPHAERLGVVREIDRWVVREAIELARDARLEVNLSGLSIGDNDLLQLIERELRLTRCDPSNLVFEITETAAIADLEKAREFALRLKGLGCRFALDDFGTGYGSFTYLRHLPVDYLKIDMDFVRNLHASEADRRVVLAIVGVARGFGIQTIAEGVEEQRTLELLSGLEVDYAQGYLIGRPAPVGR